MPGCETCISFIRDSRFSHIVNTMLRKLKVTQAVLSSLAQFGQVAQNRMRGTHEESMVTP
jgi:hypothetical protein